MATKLENLFIGEVSLVDDPAHLTPGWMIMKARGEALEEIPGVTVATLRGGAFIAIADSWVETLRKKRGDKYAEDHFASVFGPEGILARGTLSAADKRAT